MPNFRERMCKMFRTTSELKIATEKEKDKMKIKAELKRADKNITRIMNELNIKDWLKGGKF